jgi:hypothetical protein
MLLFYNQVPILVPIHVPNLLVYFCQYHQLNNKHIHILQLAYIFLFHSFCVCLYKCREKLWNKNIYIYNKDDNKF